MYGFNIKKIASSDIKTAARLQKISDEAVERVISMISKDAFTWANDKDRRVVDDSAVKILRALK